mgnify:CR=1 FL=1
MLKELFYRIAVGENSNFLHKMFLDNNNEAKIARALFGGGVFWQKDRALWERNLFRRRKPRYTENDNPEFEEIES